MKLSSLTASKEGTVYGAFTQEKNTYARILGLKRRKAFAQRGRIFGNLQYMFNTWHMTDTTS